MAQPNEMRLPRRLRPGATVADLRDAWREGGASQLAVEFREAVQFRLFRHGELLIIEYDLAHIAPGELPDGVEVRICESPAEQGPLAAITNRRTRERFRRATKGGRECLVAWRGDRPVGYTWLSDRIAHDIEQFPIPLPEDALYGWDLYVHPSERRSGIGSALTRARLLRSRELGYRVGWRAIDTGNLAAVGTVRRTAGDGTRVVGRLRYVRVLGRSWGRLIRETSNPVISV